MKVLTHQSALLSGEMDTEERLALLLRELDELRASREEQDLMHRDQLDELQVRSQAADRSGTSKKPNKLWM